jgi:cell division protein FtsI (penicillin-binding protein 3)
MSSRKDDTPRRGDQPRRGTSRDLPTDDTDDAEQGRAFGGIGDARAYTPRGRTMAERDQRTRSPRAGRTTDPFRPALQVLDGGRPQRGRRPADAAEPPRSRTPDAPEQTPTKTPAADGGNPTSRTAAGRNPTSRTTAGRTPTSRTTTGRTAADRTSSGRTGSDRTAADRRSSGRAGSDRTANDRTSSGRTGSDRTANDRTANDRTANDRASSERTATGRTPAGRTPVGRIRATGRNEPGGKRDAPREWRDGSRDRRDGTGERREATDRGTARGGRAPRQPMSSRTKKDAEPRRTASKPDARRTASRAEPRRLASKAAPRRTAGNPETRARTVRLVASEPPRLANGTRRLRLGTVLALALFAMIGVRLVALQVDASPAEAARLVELRAKRITEVKLPAPRGSILDRNGTVLAHSVEARYVGADPMLIKDPAATAAKLAPLLAVPQSELVKRMSKHQRPGGGQSRFEFLAQGVDISIGDRIAAMKEPGIVVKQDERRDVPGADLAANLIGFTGADNSGLAGLEARYDSLLRGTEGTQEFERGEGNLDKPIPGGYQRYVDPQPGTSLQLTVDADLQYEVQRILGEQARQWDATIAGAVVLDVATGEVLAQASYPPYNAAKPLDAQPADRDDVPSAIVADPGSIHKAFIFGAALEEGIIKPDSVLPIGPALERGGYRFQDSHMQPKGTKMTMPGLLALSSNVGTILIADRLGKQRVYEYQQKFGLGRATGEGMPGEAEGRILTPDEWSGSASGSVPIGMSVDATLIQMAAGYAAIANDGKYTQPHLIKAMISGKDGAVTATGEPETHRVLRPEVAQQLRTMMEAVVDEKDATGTQAAVTGYRVAGKTGTGKRLVDGQYTSSNYGSFIGMAPADHPRFVIAVSAEVPHGTGGDVAAPAFRKMMSFALLQHRVPPSTTKAPKFRIHP